MALKPAPATNVTDHVADQIRQAVYSGRFQAGQRLVERQLAAELGVSHIPIREALARLAEEGIVEHLPRRGCRVATPTARELEELADVRVLLEQLVAVRVQKRITEENEAELRGLINEMVLAAKEGDVNEVVTLDEKFHARLWELADHQLLNELASGLRGRISAFLRAATIALAPAYLEMHARTHEALLDAIAGGRPKAARDAMAVHIETAANRIGGPPGEGI